MLDLATVNLPDFQREEEVEESERDVVSGKGDRKLQPTKISKVSRSKLKTNIKLMFKYFHFKYSQARRRHNLNMSCISRFFW